MKNNELGAKMATQLSYTFGELLALGIEETPYLVEGLIPATGLCAMVGASDTGKSTLLRQLAINIADKRDDFLGYPILAKKHGVVYVSTEDDRNALAPYAIHYAKHDRVDEENFENLRFLCDGDNLIDRLKDYCSKDSTALIIIDAYADIFPGGMNANNEVRLFLNKFNTLSQELECPIMFLHHIGKRGYGQEPDRNNIIGSQGFEAKMRVVFELAIDKNDPNKRHLHILKGNYMSNEMKDQVQILNFENRIFSTTGECFSQSTRKTVKMVDKKSNPEYVKRALELRDEGLSFEKISIALKSEGIEIGKSTVHNMLKLHDGADAHAA